MVFSREWNINLPRVGMLDNRKIRFNQCPVRYTKRLASVFFKLLGVDFGLGRGVISIPDHGLPVDDPVSHGKSMIVNGDSTSGPPPRPTAPPPPPFTLGLYHLYQIRSLHRRSLMVFTPRIIVGL